MLLKEINFNEIRNNGFIGLALYENKKLLDNGFITEVLKRNPHFKNKEVIEQRPYFNEWVIEIGNKNEK